MYDNIGAVLHTHIGYIWIPTIWATFHTVMVQYWLKIFALYKENEKTTILEQCLILISVKCE